MLEMLLVLMVLMAIIAITIPGYQAMAVKKEEQRFFEILQQDVYYAQSQSLDLKQVVKIAFRETKRSYDIYMDTHIPGQTRKIPDSVTLKKTSNLTEIKFNASGSVVQSGTFRFGTSSGEKTMVVHLGGGRVVFSE